MTREEAIKMIEENIMYIGLMDCPKAVKDIKGYKQALEMAIKALEQEPCEDCISREAVLDCLTASGLKKFDYILDARDKIKNLPPVTPQPNDKALKIISETMMDMFNNKPFEEVMGNLENNMREMGIEGIDFETVEKIIDKYKTES